ncbi:MAG: hypothetical protein MZV64_14010 [Ignavibacteriales bacterium]|nr:hypothetical protein [Ignavibacteriales bacterium]
MSPSALSMCRRSQLVGFEGGDWRRPPGPRQIRVRPAASPGRTVAACAVRGRGTGPAPASSRARPGTRASASCVRAATPRLCARRQAVRAS